MSWEHDEEGLLVDVDSGSVVDIEGNKTDVVGALKSSKPDGSDNGGTVSVLTELEPGIKRKTWNPDEDGLLVDVDSGTVEDLEGNKTDLVSVLTAPESDMGTTAGKPSAGKPKTTTPVIVEEGSAKKGKKTKYVICYFIFVLIVVIFLAVAFRGGSKSDDDIDALDAMLTPAPTMNVTDDLPLLPSDNQTEVVPDNQTEVVPDAEVSEQETGAEAPLSELPSDNQTDDGVPDAEVSEQEPVTIATDQPTPNPTVPATITSDQPTPNPTTIATDQPTPHPTDAQVSEQEPDSDASLSVIIATDQPTPNPTLRGGFPLEPDVGDNGEPEDVFPLQICQADCDGDGDCAEGLECLQRSNQDIPVPDYCDGTPIDNEDYCVKEGASLSVTIATDQPTPNPSLRERFPLEPDVGDNGEPEDVFPLQICQADCDGDGDCAEGLECLQRSNQDIPVPDYCDGTPIDNEDYCVKEGDGRRRN